MGKDNGYLFLLRSKGYWYNVPVVFYFIWKGMNILEPIEYMQKALSLAKIAAGYTSPNPAVGCVIVKNDRIIGTGYHRKAGTPHAEVWALREAGEEAKGSTVYVTLEPCAHYGKTPPCAKTLVEKGVAKVVIAMLDPNPLVAGKGAAILRTAGIQVEVGLLSKEAAKLNEAFIKWMMVKQPFIVAKIAQSLDGKIATRTGKSQWITNHWARSYGHYLRSCYDGILVGIGTIIADNPLLTCRVDREGQEKPHQPVRIVLDSKGRISLSARVVTDKTTETIIITTDACADKKIRSLEEAGVKVLVAEKDEEGHVALDNALSLLGENGIQSILIEGGAAVQGSFFDSRLIDKIYAFMGNKVIGSTKALTSVAGAGADNLDECLPLTFDSVEIHDDNVLIQAYNAERKGAYVHWHH
jgi:diaminohydroxyphosphoribosylaminopyrimidine deaminase/5-amino-6-(5-phosphoribosylamino)uracil reductase